MPQPASVIPRLLAALSFARGLTVGRVPGPALQLYRIAAGMDAAAVARRLGVSKQRVSAMDRGVVSGEQAAKYRQAVDELAGIALMKMEDRT